MIFLYFPLFSYLSQPFFLQLIPLFFAPLKRVRPPRVTRPRTSRIASFNCVPFQPPQGFHFFFFLLHLHLHRLSISLPISLPPTLFLSFSSSFVLLVFYFSTSPTTAPSSPAARSLSWHAPLQGTRFPRDNTVLESFIDCRQLPSLQCRCWSSCVLLLFLSESRQVVWSCL